MANLPSPLTVASLSAALRDVDTATSPEHTPPSPPPTLEDIAPYIAQTGHRSLADVLARVNRFLWADERIARAISRVGLGLHRRTRLAHAARVGDLARCAFLVEHGARAATRDAFGRSPLTEALAHGHGAVASFLRAHGADEDPPPLLASAVSVRAVWPLFRYSPFPGGLPDSAWAFAYLGGGRIASGWTSGAVRVHDAATGDVVVAMAHGHMVVRALVVLPCGMLVSAGDDSTVRTWCSATGVAGAIMCGHKAGINSLALLRDGRVASSSRDSTVRLWDAAIGACTSVFAIPDGALCLAALPCGGFAIGARDNCGITLWSAAGERVASLGGDLNFKQRGGEASEANVLTMLPDGRLAAGYTCGTIRVWDVHTRALDAVLMGRHSNFVETIVPLLDGCLLSGNQAGTTCVWAAHALALRGGAETSEASEIDTVLPEDRVEGAWVPHGDGRLAVLPDNTLIVSTGAAKVLVMRC